MTPFAFQEKLGCKVVDGMEQVGEDQYRGGK